MEESSMICLVISREGNVVKSNTYADEISGISLQGHPLNDIFIDFGTTINLSDFLQPASEKWLINISTASKLPETFYFRFYSIDDQILAMGEPNRTETLMLRKSTLELNRELSNLTRELQKSNAELKKLNELKNQFLGIAAHDLRNPLGIIMGYSDYLLDDLENELSDDQITMLKTILTASEFMLHLLNQLLDLTAIESGKLRLEVQKTDILALIKQNANLNGIIAAKKNIAIQVHVFESIPDIILDPYKIEQVLNNLISNAVKYSLPGTIVKITPFLSGQHLTIAIEDQGQGIPENEMIKLFKPFEKLTVKGTGGEKSTGLGLSIVRNIIIGHRGKIWVESKVGIGSTFYFSLPLTHSAGYNVNNNSIMPDQA
jgi:signal transduction histidine kinase